MAWTTIEGIEMYTVLEHCIDALQRQFPGCVICATSYSEEGWSSAQVWAGGRRLRCQILQLR